jgi:hypothetical protein
MLQFRKNPSLDLSPGNAGSPAVRCLDTSSYRTLKIPSTHRSTIHSYLYLFLSRCLDSERSPTNTFVRLALWLCTTSAHNAHWVLNSAPALIFPISLFARVRRYSKSNRGRRRAYTWITAHYRSAQFRPT